MAFEILVYTPNATHPCSLDAFLDYLTAVAKCGAYTESLLLPADVRYDNPKTGNTCSITSGCRGQ